MKSAFLMILASCVTAAVAAPPPEAACTAGDGSCPASAAPAGPKGSVLLQARKTSKKGQAVVEDEAAQMPPAEPPAEVEPEPQPEAAAEPGAAGLPIPQEIAEQIEAMQAEHSHDGMSLQQDGATEQAGDMLLEEIMLSNKDFSKSTSPLNPQFVVDKNANSWGGGVSFVVDLGQLYKVNMLRTDWRVCKCLLPGALKLQASKDGLAWETFAEPQLLSWGGHDKHDHLTGGIIAKYFKFFVTAVAPFQYAAFWDLKFLGEATPRVPNVYGWYHSYKPTPQNGLSGTEILHLVGYKGSLFAGTGYWMSTASFRAAEVVRLDCPFCDWVVETAIGRWAGRTEALTAIQWTTDSLGQPLANGPKDQLVGAYYMNYLGAGRCYMSARVDDADPAPEWFSDVYYEKKPFSAKYFSARSLRLYKDSVTNADMLFATTGLDGITTGTYYARRPTLVQWSMAAEPGSGGLAARPLGIVEMDRQLYFSSAAVIYRRTDGPSPSWSPVFDMGDHSSYSVDEACGGIRGISAIPYAGSPTGHSLYFAWAPNGRSKGCLIRLDPEGDSFTHTSEICIQDAERAYLGRNVDHQQAMATFTLADYNYVTEATAKDGSKVHLVGFEVLLWSYSAAEFPVDPAQMYNYGGHKMSFYAGAGYMVRYGSGRYEVREPQGPRYNPMDIYPKLVAVRALAPSPFSGDSAVYMGGYDCNHFDAKDTAWVMRGEGWGVHEDPVPCQKELGCGHIAGLTFQTYGCDVCRGFEFKGTEIAYWTGGAPVSCQAVIDWVNGPGVNMCEASKDWFIMSRCCAHKGCNFCKATGKNFKPNNIGGTTGAGAKYNCQTALDFVVGGGTTCPQGSSWWSGPCCA